MKLTIKNDLIFLYKFNLFFVAYNGIVSISVLFIKRYLFIVINNGQIFFRLINNNYFRYLFFYINIKANLHLKVKNTILKINNFYHKKLILLGIGFKSWITSKSKYNFYLLKLGFSFDLCFFIFSNVQFICLKPTLILIKSVDKRLVNQIAMSLCNIKKWSMYKSKGIFHFNQKIKIKSLKKN